MIRTPRQLELRQLLRHTTAAERQAVRSYLATGYDARTAFFLGVFMQRVVANFDARVQHV